MQWLGCICASDILRLRMELQIHQCLSQHDLYERLDTSFCLLGVALREIEIIAIHPICITSWRTKVAVGPGHFCTALAIQQYDTHRQVIDCALRPEHRPLID